MMNEHSAGAIVYNRSIGNGAKFLLLHYASGHWDFPKGNVEAGETEKETAIREIYEETGITDIRFVEGFIQRVFYKYLRDGMPVKKKVSFYLAQTSTGNIKLSNEHHDFLWADYPSALRTLTYKSARDILIAANGFIKNNQKS